MRRQSVALQAVDSPHIRRESRQRERGTPEYRQSRGLLSCPEMPRTVGFMDEFAETGAHCTGIQGTQRAAFQMAPSDGKTETLPGF